MAARRRQLNPVERVLERFARSRAGGWFFIHVATPIDRRLLPLTNGRLSISVGQPVLLLTARGARSGEPRTTPLLYLEDGENLVVVASNAGSRKHPAWFHNVRANPEVDLVHRRGKGRYVAHVSDGAERERLWPEVVDLYAGYTDYQQRAGDREIQIVVLRPA
jgi:deazaflavin-dependent oxidoreductase (nitroreductase family)